MTRPTSLVVALLLASCAASPAAPPGSPVAAKTAVARDPGASPVTAAPAPSLAPLPDQLPAWIDDYVSSFGKNWGEAYAMSGYVLVARDGQPVFSRAYGKANRTTGAAADADTRFRIGSITKQFTAVAILQQVDKGVVRLDDPLAKYLPDFPAGDRVTIHHLLSQTSGIPSYTDDGELMRAHDKARTPAEVVATFANKPLLFAPGAEFRYSNSNYFLLGLVLQKATGQTYEDYLQAHVLRPAGLARTSTVDAPEAPDTAVGYTADDGKITPSGAIDMSVPFSAGALRSTPSDMIRWDRALAGDLLLSADAKRRMVTPAKEDYAYGVSVGTVEGREVDEHNGGIDGFMSDFARVPAERLAVVALSNNESFEPDPIVSAIVKMALTGVKVDGPVEKKPMPFDAATLARFAGEYALDPASAKELSGKVPDPVIASVRTMTLASVAGGLSFKPVGQGTSSVFLDTDGALFTKERVMTTFAPEPTKGKVAHLTMKQGGFTLRYARLANPRPAPTPR